MLAKIKINTLLLSDIHLGDRTTRCQKILELLDKYETKRLILNGDILNGLQFKRLHTEHWNILSKLRELSKSIDVMWVHGNHDAASHILSRLLGIKICRKYIWSENGKNFLAIHGHQYDQFYLDNILLRHVVYMLYNLIKSIDGSGFLIGLVRKYNGSWQRNSLEVAKGALRFGRFINADYVFCGHTHLIDRSEKRGVKYINTGCWVEGPSGYVTIVDGKAELHKVE